MNINNIHQEIDKIFDDFQNKLDENNFGLHIEPQPLNPEEDVEIVDSSLDKRKELDFSSWL